jgi:phosphoglucomutase
MPKIFDKQTTFLIADTENVPFTLSRPDLNEIQQALKPMILSASGWRKIFAENGDEESIEESISSADKVLSAGMAYVFASYIKEQSTKESPIVTIAMDSRFTGPAIADIMCRIFTSLNVTVQYQFICAAPEIMSWAGRSGETDGFAYISASHNPVGHNGVKFGLITGGVLDGKQASYLIEQFKTILSTDENITTLMDLADSADREKLKDIYSETSQWKEKSYINYIQFSEEVISGTTSKTGQAELLKKIKDAAVISPVGIIAEHNGSARALSIDREFLENLNIRIKTINDIPRAFTHRIVPEGYSLDLCREELEKAHLSDSAFQLGYVPDCDGDRGNLVYMDGDKARILEAQEVFALSVLAELAYLKWSGSVSGKTAVAVNGPTSMRIETIADSFGAEVFRAEVGEANVVNLASELREKGYTVRILGEGSNGGNITHPAAVRDPLNTAGAILKLLSLRSEKEIPGLFEIWCTQSGQLDKYKSDYSLSDIIRTLPAYTTTSAFEDDAIMRIKTESHSKLKKQYEKNFPEQWEAQKMKLNKLLGITSWKEINNEGTQSKEGVGSSCRSGKEKGGLKILFMNEKGENVAYIWLRGSGTEPVFRVLADVQGNNREAEQYLLNWQRRMITMADEGISNN